MIKSFKHKGLEQLFCDGITRQDAVFDKTAFSVVSSFGEADRDDDQYWWAQSAEARVRHIEYLRQMNYEHHATTRLQFVGVMVNLLSLPRYMLYIGFPLVLCELL